jgi:hypothetical protein
MIKIDALCKTMLEKKTPLYFCSFEPVKMQEYFLKCFLSPIEGDSHEEFLKRYIRSKGCDLMVMEF